MSDLSSAMVIRETAVEDVAKLIYQMDIAIFTKPRIHLAARNIQDVYDFLKDCRIFLGYFNDRPVAYIGCHTDNPALTEVTGMGVLPEYQGKGFGTALLQYVLDTFPEHSIYLVTHPENDQALHVYKKLGFVTTGRKENYYGDGEPRVKLEYNRRM